MDFHSDSWGLDITASSHRSVLQGWGEVAMLGLIFSGNLHCSVKDKNTVGLAFSVIAPAFKQFDIEHI